MGEAGSRKAWKTGKAGKDFPALPAIPALPDFSAFPAVKKTALPFPAGRETSPSLPYQQGNKSPSLPFEDKPQFIWLGMPHQ